MKLTVYCLACCALLCSFGIPATGEEEAEPTIKEIMKVAFKGNLIRAVGTGKATPDEQQQLLKLVKAMETLSPPKGDVESWKEKTAAVTEAVEAIINSEKDATMKLMKATNCAACHKPHKP